MGLYIGLSNILLHIDNNETGLKVMMRFLALFLWIGTIFVFFHQVGNLPSFKQSRNINSNGLQITPQLNLMILIDTSYAHEPY